MSFFSGLSFTVAVRAGSSSPRHRSLRYLRIPLLPWNTNLHLTRPTAYPLPPTLFNNHHLINLSLEKLANKAILLRFSF